MSHFKDSDTIIDVLNSEELKDYSKFFYFNFPDIVLSKKIDDTSWYARDAINWFYDKKIEGKTSIYHFDKNHKDVNIIHISHKNHAKFVFIVSGGGLFCIDTAHEGIPIGKELFNQGYDVFLLTYRTREDAHLDSTTKDINNALSFIKENKNKLNVTLEDFLLIGGSAGAFLAGSYCSSNRGYIKYNNPKPKCLCLLYPIIDFHIEEKNIKEIVIGKNPSKYLVNKYSVTNHVKNTFPPTFIVHSLDDDCVPYQQSQLLYNDLKKSNIKSRLLLYKTGKHGWGIGKRLESEEWLDIFIDFVKKI